MRFSNEKKHVIDFMFPIALFFVFAASSLVVIILSANIYSSTTKASESGFNTRTVLSYITEKIHRSDQNQAVSIGTFDGLPSLVIELTYDNDQTYVTYIYEDNGILRELFIQDGVAASADSGREIMPVHNFSMEQLSDNRFYFTCTTDSGETSSAVVSTRSEKEAPYE